MCHVATEPTNDASPDARLPLESRGGLHQLGSHQPAELQLRALDCVEQPSVRWQHDAPALILGRRSGKSDQRQHLQRSFALDLLVFVAILVLDRDVISFAVLFRFDVNNFALELTATGEYFTDLGRSRESWQGSREVTLNTAPSIDCKWPIGIQNQSWPNGYAYLGSERDAVERLEAAQGYSYCTTRHPELHALDRLEARFICGRGRFHRS